MFGLTVNEAADRLIELFGGNDDKVIAYSERYNFRCYMCQADNVGADDDVCEYCGVVNGGSERPGTLPVRPKANTQEILGS